MAARSKRARGHESLGDSAKDLRLIELLEKELRLKKAKFEEDEKDVAAKNDLIKKLEDYVAKCNALGLHYANLSPPDFAVARKLLHTAETILHEDGGFAQFAASEMARWRMLSTTFQNLGGLEKQADQLKLAVEYHTKAIEIEMKLKQMKDTGGTPAPAPASTEALPVPAKSGPSASQETFNDADNKMLLLACKKGNSDQALSLIRRKTCDLNAADPTGNTVLHHACQNRMALVVQELCKCGASVNPVNEQGNTPLHFTASCSLELTKGLLNTGVDMHVSDKSGNNALHYACLANLPDVALLLLDRGADHKARNNTGNVPLHYAVSSSMSSVVEMLISRGADINSRDHQDNTALHYACSLLLPSMAMVLIHHKPELDVVNHSGNTALLYACSNSMADIAMLMIKKNANVALTDAQGNSALHYACANQLETVAKTLLAHRDVKFQAPNDQGNTPLHYACSSNNLPIVQELVAKGADLQPQDKTQNTPLHYACLNEQADVAEFLIQEGASVHIQNSDGKTPLDYAVVSMVVFS
eukprot:NODE_406_length_1694_cov_561.962918_g323_i0.p1 GENE.NODE_406_length_1694_cov_561.962918_g323_i0~~NODE_406_length_1694_cov_561.962918_g323_i0.p1  ORF type:complete len:531 (-),score=140.63 NODE_406_length_1694_cov_561.962918_g323_i0:39-1631(-)